VRPDRQENERERTQVAARPVTPEPTIATRMLSNCLDTGYVYSVLRVPGKFVAVYKPTTASIIKLTQVYVRRLHGLLGQRMINSPISICDGSRYSIPVTCKLRLEQGKKKEKLHIRCKKGKYLGIRQLSPSTASPVARDIYVTFHSRLPAMPDGSLHLTVLYSESWTIAHRVMPIP
jgi:hypothetical protein